MDDNKRKSSSLKERSRKRARRKMLMRLNLGLAALVLVLLIVFAVKSCAGNGSKKEEQALLDNTDTFYEGIYVEDVSLGGMTMEEASWAVLERLEKDCPWSMQVVYEDKACELEDIFSHNLDEVLTEAFAVGRSGEEKDRLAVIQGLLKEPRRFQIEGEYDPKLLEDMVQKAAEELNQDAQDADLTGYDGATGEFQYSEGKDGFSLDEEDLKRQIEQAIAEKRYDAVLNASMETVKPELTRAEVKEQVTLISRFTTTTTSNADRNANIQRAAGMINGVVVKPGEEFSMNEVTGPRTGAEGYKPAGTIVNGKLVEEFGGGVCQVSTTLYNALVKGGLETTERFSHSLEPAYITPGEDAMVSYPNADLKFKNNSKSSVVILFQFAGNQLTASVYGIPVLEEGMTQEMESELIETIPIPKPEYIEDPTLKYGEEVIQTAGREGTKVKTWLVTKKDGAVISRIDFHTSVYKPKTPVIRRNSKAKPEETPEPEKTEKPEKTPKPKATKEPEITPEPVPEPTQTPVPTQEPEPLETPEPAASPEEAENAD